MAPNLLCKSAFAPVVICIVATMYSPVVAADPPETVWKMEISKDGRQVLSDGKFAVSFPKDVKVEIKGPYASASIKQTTGAKLEGYLSIERRDAPAEATKAADVQQWFEASVRDQVEKDRKSVFKSKDGETKNYNDVQLVNTSKIALGEFKGHKSITDHERALANLKIEGGLHSVAETDQYLVGDHIYRLRAGGSGAPRASALFGDHTGFHKAGLCQEFFKSAKAIK
jgi:hypothetical protein